MERGGEGRRALLPGLRDRRYLILLHYNPIGKDPDRHLLPAAIRPDVVFFGEPMPSRFFELNFTDFKACDLLIVMGTGSDAFLLCPRVVCADQSSRYFTHGVPLCWTRE